jgi:hypothetical protein
MCWSCIPGKLPGMVGRQACGIAPYWNQRSPSRWPVLADRGCTQTSGPWRLPTCFTLFRTILLFIDGNKRTGLLSALVFLALNGVVIDHGTPALYDFTMAVTDGRLDKSAIALALRQVASPTA